MGEGGLKGHTYDELHGAGAVNRPGNVDGPAAVDSRAEDAMSVRLQRPDGAGIRRVLERLLDRGEGLRPARPSAHHSSHNIAPSHSSVLPVSRETRHLRVCHFGERFQEDWSLVQLSRGCRWMVAVGEADA